jgi:hypothetical protein
MTITIDEYISVVDQAAKLGCPVPSSIAVLPENFETAASYAEFKFISEAATVKKVFRRSNFPIDDLLPTGERAAFIHNKHFEWAALLFISSALISSDPNAVSVALGIISNYATDFFKGLPSKNIKLDIVVEKKKDRTCKRISYEGNIEGLKSLSETIRSISNDD